MRNANPQVRLAVDGFDGLGKTAVIDAVDQELADRGIASKRVGRSGPDSSGLAALLTEQIKLADAAELQISNATNAHLRLARLHERIAIAERSEARVVLFDRWAVSDLSRLDREENGWRKADFAEAHQRACLTVFVRLGGDFELAMSRIEARPRERLSRAEKRGREFLKIYFNRMNDVWLNWGDGALVIDPEADLRSTAGLLVDRLLA